MNDQRNIMLTGAGSGIGRATAVRLLEREYRVFGGAIDDEEANKLQSELGRHFTAVVVDVRREESVQKAASQVAGQLGDQPLSALLNFAGVIVNGPLVDLSANELSNVLAVNLVGTHSMTRAFLPLLSGGGRRGRVINMSSASGRRTMPFAGGYSASKFGVEALSTAMRMELRPLGVDVVVFAPGLIHTPMADKILTDLSKTPSLAVYEEPLRRFAHKTRESVKKGLPLDRVVEGIITMIETPSPKSSYEIHHSYLRDVLLMRAIPVKLREAIITRTLGLHTTDAR